MAGALERRARFREEPDDFLIELVEEIRAACEPERGLCLPEPIESRRAVENGVEQQVRVFDGA